MYIPFRLQYALQLAMRRLLRVGSAVLLTLSTQWKMKTLVSATVFAVILSLAISPSAATAAVIGFLGNFDVINDTGQTAYGFEIDLEGLHSSDISDVFGGPGRGFPTGRGYDTATSVERYGSPTISEYTNGAIFGTKVTYSALHDGTNWDYGTPTTPRAEHSLHLGTIAGQAAA